MLTPNELRTIAQRLREYKANPHHINPMSGAFAELIDEASKALCTVANATGQVMGRIHHTENGVVCALNSVGLQLADDTKLFASAELAIPAATVGETITASRKAWLEVVHQKHPSATIRVVDNAATAVAPSGMVVGQWVPGNWWVK